MGPFKFLSWIRFHTTFYLHMKAHKMTWYKEWHQGRLHHHFHIAMLAFYAASIFFGLLGVFISVTPKNALASTNYEWNLNTPSEYTYNPSYIQFNSGVAQSTGYSDLKIYAYDMYCTDVSTCFLLGDYGGGKLYKTTDGGENWVSKNPGTTQSLLSAYFANANVGYIAATNATITKTTNGGNNWSAPQTMPPEATGRSIYGIYCKDPEGGTPGDNCYAVGGNGTTGQSIILRTTNGGTTWTAQAHETAGYTYLDGIFCTDSNTCYAAGHSGKLLKTTDGGTTWVAQTSNTTNSLFRAYCTDSNTCYMSGSGGTILKTTDGGSNWVVLDSGNPTALFRDIQFTDSQTGYAVGYIGTNGLIVKTTDGGATWATSWTVPASLSYLYGISCPSANVCYIGGFNQVKTVNAGSSWTPIIYQPIPTIVPNTSQDFTDLAGFKETLGVGNVGTIHYQISNNDGATWYWYNSQSSAWEIAYDSYYQNTAAEINSNITTFTGNYGGGTGKFKWKAVFYLASGGDQMKLDSVQLSLKGNTPNKPESLTISDVSNRDKDVWALALSWDSPLPGAGEINFFKIERSDNGGPWTEVGTTNDGTKRAYAEVVPSSEATYSYRVRSVDHDEVGGIYNDESEPSNVVSMMPTGKYSSLPSLIGTPTTTTTATSANISWSTDRVSSSTVKYSTDTSYTFIASSPQVEVTSHAVSLKGLLPGTTYHYKLQSLDTERTYGTDVYYTGEYTLTTPSATEISGLKIYDILSGSALVSWQTSTDMATILYYGKDNSYGTTIEANSGTNHVAKLIGLQDNTTYHLKVSGTDAGGNAIHSDDYSFETLALPKATNIDFQELRDRPSSTIKITWETNIPTSSVVEYSESGGKPQEVSAYQLVTKHEMVASGLKDKDEYTMTIKGRDAFGNEVTTSPQKVKTDIDARPPEISEITTETSIDGYGSGAKAQMIVSWSTDEPATSQVEYSKGDDGKNLSMVTQEDPSLTTSHAVVISGLEPSTSYYFRIVTKDRSTNETKSELKSALTDQIRLSIFDIMLKSFESTLGWLFGVQSIN